MDDRHANFDADLLTARKNNFGGYQFCPWSRHELQQQTIDGTERLVCPDASCGFIHYHNPVPAAGVIVVIDDQILLVKRAHPPKVGWWCLPAGFMEWSEHPAETAVREVREETGLTVRIIDFFEVYAGTDDPRNNAVLLLYRGEPVDGTLEAADDALDVQYWSFDSLPEQIAFVSHRQAIADYSRRYRDR